MNPEQLLYSQTHEWVYVETDPSGAKIAVVGITAYALEVLTELVYLELPEVGRLVEAGKPFGEVESVKAVSDLYSPVDGQVVASNQSLCAHLDQLAQDPYGDGWLVKIRLADDSRLANLMNYEAYQRQCQKES